ncbi:hypothetical protein EDEG_00232 [Edhazardia aedis USNM 41457]|uniref:Uncharacterized protein n=1 Tax=Edhazardia aedis (strain USNM 41457) TaxID=1003232 RepID=J9DPH6_EDHAE|nr:hypothetical protein EDEG_00232 [Edhazardia aedis USNM 41457]|eukprot:EJW03252.1 hypothetical protein EDEG_00232 [Edhazardia aedis USNM 41457]
MNRLRYLRNNFFKSQSDKEKRNKSSVNNIKHSKKSSNSEVREDEFNGDKNLEEKNFFSGLFKSENNKKFDISNKIKKRMSFIAQSKSSLTSNHMKSLKNGNNKIEDGNCNQINHQEIDFQGSNFIKNDNECIIGKTKITNNRYPIKEVNYTIKKDIILNRCDLNEDKIHLEPLKLSIDIKDRDFPNREFCEKRRNSENLKQNEENFIEFEDSNLQMHLKGDINIERTKDFDDSEYSGQQKLSNKKDTMACYSNQKSEIPINLSKKMLNNNQIMGQRKERNSRSNGTSNNNEFPINSVEYCSKKNSSFLENQETLDNIFLNTSQSLSRENGINSIRNIRNHISQIQTQNNKSNNNSKSERSSQDLSYKRKCSDHFHSKTNQDNDYYYYENVLSYPYDYNQYNSDQSLTIGDKCNQNESISKNTTISEIESVSGFNYSSCSDINTYKNSCDNVKNDASKSCKNSISEFKKYDSNINNYSAREPIPSPELKNLSVDFFNKCEKKRIRESIRFNIRKLHVIYCELLNKIEKLLEIDKEIKKKDRDESMKIQYAHKILNEKKKCFNSLLKLSNVPMKQNKTIDLFVEKNQLQKQLNTLHSHIVSDKENFIDILFANLQAIINQGSLEDDIRLLEKLDKQLDDIKTFETPRFFKIGVQLEIAKKYVKDMINLKKINCLKYYYL